MYLNRYKILTKRLLLALSVYPILRVLFFLFNLDYFSEFNFLAFCYGLRFDLASVMIINFPFIIFSLIPISSNLYASFLKTIFIVVNSFFIFINIVDFKYFSFTGKKLTADIFGIMGDVNDQFGQLVLNYWYSFVIFFLFIFALFKLYPKDTKGFIRIKFYQYIPLNLLVLIIGFIFVRGGLQLRSIGPKDAFIFDKVESAHLALNSAYTFLRSLEASSLPEINYYKSDSELYSKFRAHRAGDVKLLGANIILIIVESLSTEYIDKGYTPNISNLISKSFYSKNNFANGRRSIEVLPSIMAGIPSLIDKPLYQSQYQANTFYPLPRLLKNRGYETSFFHGGKKGTMEFDSYSYSIGIDKYFSMNDYPDSAHFDNHWGIYDHYFLDFFVKKLSESNSPFFSTIFTLSSHQPYSLPLSFQNKFDRGSLPIHESIGYIDHALGTFFKQASKEDWFDNTVFIITADHTQKLESRDDNYLAQYRVPLIIYSPHKDLSQIEITKVTQHADIMPTILDILDIDSKFKLPFGASVFSRNKGRVINKTSSGYYLYDGDDLVSFDLNKVTYQKRENKELYLELKAYIQYLFNGLRENKLYDYK